jgi:hypothetical protein
MMTQASNPDIQTGPVSIGWKEWLALPGLGIPAIKAKIDTGARSSALHTFYLQEFEQDGRLMVKFGVHPLQRRDDIEIHCQAPVIDRRRVKDSGGHGEDRYFVETMAVLGPVRWPVQVSLTNRDNMMFRMLLGRKALEGRFAIYAEQRYLNGRALGKRAYQSK